MKLTFEQDIHRMLYYGGDYMNVPTSQRAEAEHDFVWRFYKDDSPDERAKKDADLKATVDLLKGLYDSAEVADFAIPFDGRVARFRGLIRLFQIRSSPFGFGVKIGWTLLDSVPEPSTERVEGLMVNGAPTGLELVPRP